jgi:hypothetical protein
VQPEKKKEREREREEKKLLDSHSTEMKGFLKTLEMRATRKALYGNSVDDVV